MANFTYVDTDAMEWKPDPGIPGFLAKFLYVDEESGAFTNIHYVPPGWGEEILHGKPYRHYHASVYERSFCLFGDFPHWEFSEPADTDGELVVFRGGVFMDRPPMTIHGLLPEPASVTGATTLSWNTGGGTSVEDPAAKDETFVIPFDDYHGINLEFTSPRIFQTAEVPWRPHPAVADWKIKPLCDAAGAAPACALVAIPPDWRATAAREIDAVGERRWLFVVSGDLSVQVKEGQRAEEVSLHARCYLAWQDPARVDLSAPTTSQGGAVVLCVGHTLSG